MQNKLISFGMFKTNFNLQTKPYARKSFQNKNISKYKHKY